jgi:hypothetical protein
MRSNNEHFLWHACKLGALNAILFGIITDLVLRMVYNYERTSLISLRTEVNLNIDLSPYPFQWWYLPLMSVALIIPATILVYRYLLSHLNSYLWLWQAVGIAAVFECYLLTLTMDWWNAHFSEMGADYWAVAYSIKPVPWIFILPAVSVFNLLFALFQIIMNNHPPFTYKQE